MRVPGGGLGPAGWPPSDFAQARQMFFREDVINSLRADEVSWSSTNHLAVLSCSV